MTNNMIPYSEARTISFGILKKKLESQGRKPVFDDDTKKLYRLLTLYFSNNPEFEEYYFNTQKGKLRYNLKKGLLLLGSTGRSKSFSLMHVFPIFCSHHSPEHKYRIFTSSQIELDFLEKGHKAFFKYEKAFIDDSYVNSMKPNNLYFDEIGYENKVIKVWGNEFKPIEKILHIRYEQFIQFGVKTHASSNLTLEEMKDYYNEKVYSRIFEMFNIIITKGADLRLNFE